MFNYNNAFLKEHIIVTSDAESTDHTNGTLIVRGGTGIRGNLNVAGDINGKVTQIQRVLISETPPIANQVLAASSTSNAAWTLINPVSGFGNVLRVDKLGSDVTGARNGLPFLTINAAINEALSGDCIWIFPGTYNESFTIPSGVSIIGLSSRAVVISLDVSANTDLITMGENSRLEDVSLTLTSSDHFTLKGIVFPGTTSSTAKLRRLVITVNNNSAAVGGTSTIYGIHSNGTATPTEETSAIRAVTISVLSIGGGNKRGILVDTANSIHLRDTNVICRSSGGAGSYIGVETSHANAIFTSRHSSIEGDTSDISQTLGSINIGTTNLLNSTANSLGFGTIFYQSAFIFADDTGLPSNQTRFMRIGSGNVSNNEIFIKVMQDVLVNAVHIRARIGPGGARTDTFTLRRNSVDTIYVLTLTGAETNKLDESKSVKFFKNDDLSIKVVTAMATGTTDIVLCVNLY